MNTLEILDRLIGFDTTSRLSNLALIEWVEDFLHARGIETRRVAREDGAKANLYAIIGPKVEGGVILSGHTDVVPVDGQPWSSDPFTLTRRDGRYFGRGVADMKTFLAAALSHVDAARAADVKRPIILAFSYDEEVGCLGAPAMIEDLAKVLPTPLAAIVGEPTSMQVVSGHKGIATFIVTITGREAHSSQIDHGVSAIMEAVPLMQMIADMGQKARLHGPFNALFDPPHATMTIGLVNGGTAVNILARTCEFAWDLRSPPGDDPEDYIKPFIARAREIDAAIKARAPEAGVTVTRRSSTPALAIAPDSAAEQLARRLTGDNETRVASYAAEAGLFQNAGFPTILCGPGDIAQAHQPDEWIAEDQITRVDAWMRSLIQTLRTA